MADDKKKSADTGQMVNGKPTMTVKVYAPFKVYFEGDAFSISAASATGPFDILPRHHNFITLLLAGDVTVRPVEGQEQKIRISGGVMHVKKDNVVVFLDV
ncbi:MAG TPA: F0F1 ATP synthase subunit epsilon [Candidatus Saccharimonadales bacterium]|nr:F0F1 ATP synthase subunit epsilon [Candidatus Saccharimonadales bacterium]